jgi:prephenate dehydratase
MRVGYQGQSGAYSSIVIDQLFGHVAKEGQRTLSDLFLALQSEKVDIAVIPIENTTVGTITQSYDLLDEYAFTIVGEYYLDIEHALIAISGVSVEDIRFVYSHPAALGQCQRYLSQFPDWELVPVHDTAGAAAMLQREKRIDAAAIAAKTAGDIHRLAVIASNINDYQHNQTRFVVLARSRDKLELTLPQAVKTSISVRLNHRAGALASCLNILQMFSINMTNLIARPDKDNAWAYIFFIDLGIDAADPVFKLLLDNFRQLQIKSRILGSYGRFNQRNTDAD